MPQNTSTRATQHCHVTFAAGTTGTTVVATYNTGSCFKLYGGVLTVGQYTWYELTDGSKVSQSLHSLRQAKKEQWKNEHANQQTYIRQNKRKTTRKKEEKKKDRYCCVIKRIKVFQKGTSLLWKKKLRQGWCPWNILLPFTVEITHRCKWCCFPSVCPGRLKCLFYWMPLI